MVNAAPGTVDLDSTAKDLRDQLKSWVLLNYTELGDLYDDIIASTAFPAEYSAIKGDIFVSFIAARQGHITVGTEQVYFGKRSAGGGSAVAHLVFQP